MKTIIFNSMKEKIRNKSIFITAVLGIVIVTFLIMNADIKFDGVQVKEFNKLLPIAIIMCSFFSGLISVMISVNTIPKEFERKFSDLVMVRGISEKSYVRALAISNIIVSVLCSFGMFTSIFIMAGLFGKAYLFHRLFLAMIILSINYAVLSGVISLLSIKVHQFLVSVLGIMLFFLGAFHGILKTGVNLMSGTAATIYKALLWFIPDLAGIHKISGAVVTKGNVDIMPILTQIVILYFVFLGIGTLKRRTRQ